MPNINSRLRLLTEQDYKTMRENYTERNGCFEWNGKLENNVPYYYGYRVPAELFSYKHGRRPEGGVTRSCKNVKCIREDHLIEGQHGAFNVVIPDTKGELNGKAILTEANVIEIWSSPESNKVLGDIYGVDKTTIQKIRSGKNWKWLTETL